MLHVSAVLAGRGAVRALVPSPALDVLGVGLGSGAASLVDMRTDELVACFEDAAGAGAAAAAAGGRADAGGLRVAAGGACTALAFSTCAGFETGGLGPMGGGGRRPRETGGLRLPSTAQTARPTLHHPSTNQPTQAPAPPCWPPAGRPAAWPCGTWRRGAWRACCRARTPRT